MLSCMRSAWSEAAHGEATRRLRLHVELGSAWSETERGLRLRDELGRV